jgi:hypothetical protein
MGHVSVRHACPICFGLSPFPITYSPCFSSYYPLALLSGQLSRHFPSDIKRRPLYPISHLCCIGGCHHGDGWHHVVLPTVAPLTAMILPTVSPSSAPTQFLFDAVDDLSKMYLNNKWSGSIKWRALPVFTNSRLTP